MTELPEHLLRRAQRAREKVEELHSPPVGSAVNNELLDISAALRKNRNSDAPVKDNVVRLLGANDNLFPDETEPSVGNMIKFYAEQIRDLEGALKRNLRDLRMIADVVHELEKAVKENPDHISLVKLYQSTIQIIQNIIE